MHKRMLITTHLAWSTGEWNRAYRARRKLGYGIYCFSWALLIVPIKETEGQVGVLLRPFAKSFYSKKNVSSRQRWKSIRLDHSFSHSRFGISCQLNSTLNLEDEATASSNPLPLGILGMFEFSTEGQSYRLMHWVKHKVFSKNNCRVQLLVATSATTRNAVFLSPSSI